MQKKRLVAERELAALAKSFREKAGKSKAEAARELGVSQPSLFGAEEEPDESLTRLRVRLIEAYSPYRVSGPVFVLTRRR